jgi:hypothetical protein
LADKQDIQRIARSTEQSIEAKDGIDGQQVEETAAEDTPCG